MFAHHQGISDYAWWYGVSQHSFFALLGIIYPKLYINMTGYGIGIKRPIKGGIESAMLCEKSGQLFQQPTMSYYAECT